MGISTVFAGFLSIGALKRLWSSGVRQTPVDPRASHLKEIAQCDPEFALRRLGSSLEGLLDREAEERLLRVGRNVAAPERRDTWWGQLFHHLWNPLNILLTTLAAVSGSLGDVEAAVIIAAMVLLSVLLSFVQEYRSNQAAQKLRAMVSTTATVLRQDRRAGVPPEVQQAFQIHLPRVPSTRRELPLELLVPGDLVVLSAGDMIPADCRVVQAKDLFLNQSSLTGEALPIEKFAHAETSNVTDALQCQNICFMGTNVVSGSALAAVVETGPRTYFGALASVMNEARPMTNFDRGIRQFIWLMLRFMMVMVPIVFLVNGFMKHDWMEALLFSMAVAVGLTPEMLPMLVTVNLAKGALAMSAKKVIVKRLHSIQNFGAMDVLCTDKTGTLTQDKIILEKHVDIHGADSERVLELAYLNSYYQSGLKNLLDVAVLDYVDVHERLNPAANYTMIDEIPFDFQRRRMSVVLNGKEERVLIAKGAVEEIFSCCTHVELGGTVSVLSQAALANLKGITQSLNEDGFRVIAIAYKPVPNTQAHFNVRDEADLILLGYIAFLDPPKDSAKEAIAALNRHGVAVKILTGDNDIVTRKVCKEVGLPVDRILLGSQIEDMDEATLAHVAEKVSVFAKLSPQQKARVISALHLKGHVVGFLGDGINDGPALKTADVGISVDTAVDIAKDSADIILLEKSLMVLEEGVIEGRKVFGNIIKYVRMGASSNFGNMFSVIGASAFLPFLPMLSIQVLTNNLLYDFSQTAIPTDHVDQDYLLRPRRWDMASITRYMVFLGPISSIFDYATFALMYFYFGAATEAGASLFQTGWFVESLVSQTLIIHIIRTGRVPFIQSRASGPLILTSLLICALGIYLPYSPFAHALGFVPLPMAYWPWLVAIIGAYLALAHVVKTWVIRRYGWN